MSKSPRRPHPHTRRSSPSHSPAHSVNLPKFDSSILDETLKILLFDNECMPYIQDAAKFISDSKVGQQIVEWPLSAELGIDERRKMSAKGMGVLFLAGAACALKALDEGYIPDSDDVDGDGFDDEFGDDLP